MEHGRVIDGIYLGVVGGCGYFPILDIGGAVFDLAACACAEKCHTGHQYRKYFFRNPNPKNGIDLGDGTQLLIYNLGAAKNYAGVDQALFRIFQIKLAASTG